MVDGVDMDLMVTDLRQLSGEDPVDVGAGEEWIASRFQTNAGNALATTWLEQRFIAMGYTPMVQEFDALGGNVLVEKVGAVHPDRRVIICGHYDAMPGGNQAAPAADDDGTGVCAVLEAARLMAPYTFENTVVFALWDEEEQGLRGSRHYALQAAVNDLDIVAVINIDMVGYDSDQDRRMRLHTRPIANSLAIKDTALAANADYGIDMDILVVNPGFTYSDHAAFWEESRGAILLIEDFEGDGNPGYHTVNDVIDVIDTSYWADVTRLGLAVTAAWAVPYEGTIGVAESTRAPGIELAVYPNPSSGPFTVKLRCAEACRVRVEVLDATGRVVARMQEGMLTAGEHAFRSDRELVAPGNYSIRCITGEVVRTSALVLLP